MATTENYSDAINKIKDICAKSKGISRFYPYGGSGYKDSVRHFLESSSDVAQAGVQPGTIEDVAEIIKVLAEYKTPFAIKGGGHATAPGLSSTKGVQVYMSFFDHISYDPNSTYLTIGAGCLFDQVYREVQRHGRNVVGGSASQGVGVGGWYLGGGYSLLTNHYGLGIDNIVKIQVVLPTGNVVTAQAEGEHSDLFFALRGGRNKFGIVTEFVLKTVPYYNPYGGLFTYAGHQEGKVKQAIADYVGKEQNQQAVIVAAYRYTQSEGTKPDYNMTVLCSYDGTPSVDPFKEFQNIPPSSTGRGPRGRTNDEVILQTRSFLEMDALFASNYGSQELLDGQQYRVPFLPVQDGRSQARAPRGARGGGSEEESPEAPLPPGGMSGVGEVQRGRFGCIMVTQFKKELIDAIGKEAEASSLQMAVHGGQRVIFDIWPTHPDAFAHSSPALWPHTKDKTCGPMLAYFLWQGQDNDDFWVKNMQDALARLRKIAIDLGCAKPDLPVYSNTTLETTSLKEIYRQNYDDFEKARHKYDPNRVMDLVGGFPEVTTQ